MPIPGTLSSPENRSFQLDSTIDPTIALAVSTTLKVYDMLDILDSEAEAKKAFTERYTDLMQLGEGRFYPDLTAKQASSEQLWRAAVDLRPQDVADDYRYHELWTPGTEPDSYTEEELDGSVSDDSARIALFNTDKTGVDPILHHLGLPYDDYAKNKWNPDASTTQLEAIEQDKRAFEAAHPGYSLDQLGFRAALTLVIMDRIANVDPRSEKYILNRGYLRTELGRRTVDGYSVVGVVNSDVGRAGLGGGRGSADSYIGVGVSAGPKS